MRIPGKPLSQRGFHTPITFALWPSSIVAFFGSRLLPNPWSWIVSLPFLGVLCYIYARVLWFDWNNPRLWIILGSVILLAAITARVVLALS